MALIFQSHSDSGFRGLFDIHSYYLNYREAGSELAIYEMSQRQLESVKVLTLRDSAERTLLETAI